MPEKRDDSIGRTVYICEFRAMSDDPAIPASAAEFPRTTREQWRALVADVLRGVPFERLVSKTYDGISIEPLYARDPVAQPVFGRQAGTPWQVLQRIEHPDPAMAHAQALDDLANGATGLSLVLRGAIGAHGFGITPEEASLAAVLDGVELHSITLDVQAGWPMEAAFRALDGVVRKHGIAPAAIDIRFGFDPIGALVKGAATSWHETTQAFVALMQHTIDAGYRGPPAVADARVIHEAGGSEAQELAYALAAALAYLRALEASGTALDDARRAIYFRLAADADQFLTMAKLRALRKLWARIEAACGLAPRPLFIAAETAWRMMTRRDAAVNMLRATIAVVAAGLGGVNAVTVLPHTAAIGLPDGFARRIARNTQLILLEESNLAKVADPAAGAGGFEALTHQLCESAWTLFGEIERAGGIAAALECGLLQGRVAAVRAQHEKAVARRIDALTGTSAFPDINEVPATVLQISPLPSVPAPTPGGGRIITLPSIRVAEPYETLRVAADRALAISGARPKVFLATLGRLADFSARANYAKDFFEAGSIAAVMNEGFADLAAMVEAFAASGAKLACLCGTDDAYAAEAVSAAKALREASAKHIYLAGRPSQAEAALRAAGVGTFIHTGCDVVATLKAAHAELGLT